MLGYLAALDADVLPGYKSGLFDQKYRVIECFYWVMSHLR